MLLGSGTLVVVAGSLGGLRLTGRDDDALRALGVRPRPVPDPADTSLLTRAAGEQAVLLGRLVSERAEDDPLALVLTEQLDVLGGPPVPADTPEDPDAAETLARAVALAGRRREGDALAAVSPDLGRVLAAVAAGLAQVALALEAA